MAQLLTREEFRHAVFERDGFQCVMCGHRATGEIDSRSYSLFSHHIMERRLWADGGYYLDNGASLCEDCHISAERTTFTCDEFREKAGISRVVLPEHLYEDYQYDKWGNILLANGTRLKGELFFDESVQKVLNDGGVINLFVPYVKYPRTYHLPWSNPSSDDKVIKSLSSFEGQEVVVTEKIDGEATSFYRDHIHARSLDFITGEDRGLVKSLWGMIAFDIPEGWRICGENVYAKHSIHYQQLHAYFQVYSIWNEINQCLSWDETLEWVELLNLTTVPVLYRGMWDPELIKSLHQPMRGMDESEGYVVRLAGGFEYGAFRTSIAKFVRPNHVASDHHWRYQRIIPNVLASKQD